MFNIGKKDKKNKKKESKKKNNATQPKDEDNAEVKEVLDLFNKIEELVVDGDPRIREALNQKPVIQNLLRDDSSLYGLSPRSVMFPQQQNQGGIIKEGTNTSLLSQRRYIPQNRQLFQQQTQVPVQTQTVGRSPRKNIIVPPIAIPEHSTLGDTFSDGYHAALVKQHPDGTLESTRMENPLVNETIQRVPQNVRVQPVRQPVQSNFQTVVQPYQPPPLRQRPIQRPRQNVQKSKQKPVPVPQYHSFIYDEGDEKNTVQIQITDNDIRQNDSNLQASLEPQTIPNNSVNEATPVEDIPTTQLPPPQLESTLLTLMPTSNTVVKTKGQQTAIFSKVIGEEGGSLVCFGCKLEVPKNGVEKKSLFRLSILDISQVPHKTDRIFHYMDNSMGSAIVAITPAINVSPVDAPLTKPVTIKLPTCVAVHDDNRNENTENEPITAEDHTDIKADDIIVKLRNKNTKDVWTDIDTEVFRSSDSVIFKMQELGDVCAFYQSNAEVQEILNKRLAVFLFKSNDNRKNQFVSILITEDLPHVTQKGIESMPQWLKFTDSSTNMLLPEGRNLIIYIEPQDRTLCSSDAHKIEIPWENLWHPESIIRKHIRVSLMNRDTPALIQVFLDDGSIQMNSEFIWRTKHHSIQLPELMTTGEDIGLNERDAKWEDEIAEKERLDQEKLKQVTWKPDTPVPRYVTNKGLLNYAQMQ